MKIVLFFLIIFAVDNAYSKQKKRFYDFFKDEVSQEKKQYKYNPYEEIISGSLALAVGNIGYFSEDSKTMKLTYSFVQTIGFINIGRGIYNYNKPRVLKNQYNLLKKYPGKGRKKTIEYFAEGMVRNVALDNRARRLSLFYTSSLLTAQYLINILGDKWRGKENKELKNIYYFLGGVNIIIASYSALYKDRYESFLEKNKLANKRLKFTPFLAKNSVGSYIFYTF